MLNKTLCTITHSVFVQCHFTKQKIQASTYSHNVIGCYMPYLHIDMGDCRLFTPLVSMVLHGVYFVSKTCKIPYDKTMKHFKMTILAFSEDR